MPHDKIMTHADVPHSLNGHPVKAFSISKSGDRALVLVHREGYARDQWVAATYWPALGKEWMWGNYFDSYEQADAYRRNWIRTAHGDRDAEIEAGTRIHLEGRIGGWQ